MPYVEEIKKIENKKKPDFEDLGRYLIYGIIDAFINSSKFPPQPPQLINYQKFEDLSKKIKSDEKFDCFSVFEAVSLMINYQKNTVQTKADLIFNMLDNMQAMGNLLDEYLKQKTPDNDIEIFLQSFTTDYVIFPNAYIASAALRYIYRYNCLIELIEQKYNFVSLYEAVAYDTTQIESRMKKIRRERDSLIEKHPKSRKLIEDCFSLPTPSKLKIKGKELKQISEKINNLGTSKQDIEFIRYMFNIDDVFI